MVHIKKILLFIPVIIIILSLLMMTFTFALWNKDTEVRFRLSISSPEDDFVYPEYDTVSEGLEVIGEDLYTILCNKMGNFDFNLDDRLEELNNLHVGGITQQEVQQECNYYRNVVLAGFGDYINQYGRYINELGSFYSQLPQEEKDKYPDFWTNQFQELWAKFNHLWELRNQLYLLVNEVEQAGYAKVGN